MLARFLETPGARIPLLSSRLRLSLVLSALDSRPFWQKGYGPVANAGNLRMRIYTPRVVADRIMMQDDFVRLHKFLLETDAISDISDDVREVVEKEWPELVHKLPPKKPNA